jgi:hypothetical protein
MHISTLSSFTLLLLLLLWLNCSIFWCIHNTTINCSSLWPCGGVRYIILCAAPPLGLGEEEEAALLAPDAALLAPDAALLDRSAGAFKGRAMMKYTKKKIKVTNMVVYKMILFLASWA